MSKASFDEKGAHVFVSSKVREAPDVSDISYGARNSPQEHNSLLPSRFLASLKSFPLWVSLYQNKKFEVQQQLCFFLSRDIFFSFVLSNFRRYSSDCRNVGPKRVFFRDKNVKQRRCCSTNNKWIFWIKFFFLQLQFRIRFICVSFLRGQVINRCSCFVGKRRREELRVNVRLYKLLQIYS